MATVFLSPIGNYFPSTGTSLVLLSGGLLNTYAAGSSTPQPTYTTSTGNVQNANPIVLNSDGRAPQEIWLVSGQAYKLVLTDSLSNIIGTWDNISGIDDPLSPGLSTAFLSTSGGTITGNLVVTGTVSALSTASIGGNLTVTGTVLSVSNVNIGGGLTVTGTAFIGGNLTVSGNIISTTGSFTITLTGFTSTVTGTAVYSLTNNVVTLFIPPLTGTSNTTALTGSGLPAAITPATNHLGFPCIVQDNSSVIPNQQRVDVNSAGTLTFYTTVVSTTFTNSGTKGIPAGVNLTYNLN